MQSPLPVEKTLEPPPVGGDSRAVRAAARYWDAVGASTAAASWETLWRTHSDAINGAWLAPRLASLVSGRVLKTDLFDESLTPGLYPVLAAHAREVVGIDVAQSTLGAAGSRHRDLRIAAADVRRLPFGSAVFDAVVSNSTLDHFGSIGEIAASLGELHRVLRQGGRLLLTLDNLANPVVALRSLLPYAPLHRLGLVPYEIGVTCTAGTLTGLLRRAGFEVLEVEAILHCPRVLAVAAARLVCRHGSAALQRRFLEGLMRFERLGRWRSRFASGHFIAVVAQRPTEANQR